MLPTRKLRFAVIGTGFWSNYQIAAWNELPGVELAALYNRTRSRAVEVGQRFGVTSIYDDVEMMLDNEEVDFVDIITDVDTHGVFTKMAAAKGIDVICQKPMAASFREAGEMVDVCKQNNSKLLVHENFRWQAPVRRLKQVLDSGVIGNPFKGRVSFCSAFPVFQNQPFLASLEHFIITDIGSHVLDIARFLFGEAKTLVCHTQRINQQIRGEDVANVLMVMESGLHCYVEMSYASILEKESFPQTLVLVEGDKGSVHLTNDFELRTTTRQGTEVIKVEPKMYPWVDPAYAVVHSSIVECNRDILSGLSGGKAETTGEDNLKTVRLVWSAYESAATGKTVSLS